ncbi:type II RES/Xre toxin-antitoxin system antitoxin [Methylocaldum sp. SAD2]|uniref:type II RES/Xre toxin-antitoxin system antitoxin n=1 Tax=Methylocaldum sp. GT1BB TaxID=3438963 RepID=UPI00143DAC50
MSITESIVDLWGGPSILGPRVQAEHELIPFLRQSLPFVTLERTMAAFALTREEIAAILDLPGRTLTRRKQQHRQAVAESDRLFCLSRVLAHAERVLGIRGKAAEWLHRPNRALHGSVPVDLLDTDIGATQVDDVLGRLEHGVFS